MGEISVEDLAGLEARLEFDVICRLGSGGFGHVYLARHRRLDRYCAVKVLKAEWSNDPDYRTRFEMEGRAASRLDHPNLVTIYDQGERNGVLFIVMQYIDGVTLKELLEREAPLAPIRAVDLLTQVAAALDAVHRSGLVHRDVKPENMLMRVVDGREEVKLTDFGIAFSDFGERRMTSSLEGPLLTPRYASPERWRGDHGSAATDVYALACVLFECLAGQPPFLRDSAPAYLAAHCTEDPPALIDIKPDLPRGLATVLAKGLAKAPGSRWPSAGAMLAAARSALRQTEPTVVAGSAGDRPAGDERRRNVPQGPPPPPPPPPPSERPAAPRSPHVPAAPRRAVTTVRPPVARHHRPAWSRTQRIGFGVLAVLLACIGFTLSRVGLDSLGSPPSTSTAGSDSSPTPVVESGVPVESAHSDLATWVVQLASVPVGSDAELLAQYREVTAAAGTVKVVRSDELPIWKPGYYVMYHVGTFTDGRAAVRYCDSIHRSVPNDCGGRYVSDDAGDRFRYCATMDDVAACSSSRPKDN